MKFSICIPNFNYGKFLERTVRSVLQQSYDDFEILVSDNASTDDSVAVVRAIDDPRIRLTVNRCNVGFARNLDKATHGATGDVMILLSSDDVMKPDALQTYARTYAALGPDAAGTILCSSCDVIDENDRVTGAIEVPGKFAWLESDLSVDLGTVLGFPAYRVDAADLLGRSLRRMQNPFNFCATAYPRGLYEAIEGYGGNRLIGPDKRFNWYLLSVARSAVLLRRPLFGYRVHSQNQSAQQIQSGALKYLVDEYVNVFDTDAALLSKAGVSRRQLECAFIEYDVVRHGLALLAEGRRTMARRTIALGKAAYPSLMRRNWKAWAFTTLASLGPVGTWIAAAIRRRYAEAA